MRIRTRQRLPISTLCRMPRTRTGKVVVETIAVPLSIRVLGAHEAPLAVRIDVAALQAGRTTHGRHRTLSIFNAWSAGTSRSLDTVDFLSPPEGGLCVDAGSVSDTSEGNGVWRNVVKRSLRTAIALGRTAADGLYAGPVGASDVEWTEYPAACSILQTAVDGMFVFGDRLYAPAHVPVLVRSREKQDGIRVPVWTVENTIVKMDPRNEYVPIVRAAAEMEDVAGCVEIAERNLVPGAAPTLAEAAARMGQFPSSTEIAAAGRVVEAAGLSDPPRRTVDWEGLLRSMETLHVVRTAEGTANGTAGIVLDLGRGEFLPAPGVRPGADDDRALGLGI